jgi:ribosomal silencing factor RsfS
VDFGYAIIHVMTQDAREKYQLEELWGDAPREDIVKKLDAEAKKRKAAAE